MKNGTFLIKVFKITCLALLIAIPVSYLFHNAEGVRNVLFTVIFCVIGLAYLVGGYVWKNKILKSTLFVCGVYLIVMNFLPPSGIVTSIGLVCILGPLFIFRFTENGDKKEDEAINAKAN